MADWEILTSARTWDADRRKYVNKAQCPYCEYIVEYGDNGVDCPPENCPDCGKKLYYARVCAELVDITDDPICRHRGSCYSCSLKKGEVD